MSEVVKDLITSILIRIRDPQGSMTGESGVSVRQLAIDLLSRTQQIYNTALQLNIHSISFTTQPLLLWYSLADVIDGNNQRLTRITHITYQNRDLTKASFSDLKSIDRKWHRVVGSRLECFIPLGYTHFILWPLLDHQDTCTLYGPLLTPSIQDENIDTLSIEDDNIPLLIQLVELILSNRSQDDVAFSTLLRNFSQYLPQEIQGRRNATT